MVQLEVLVIGGLIYESDELIDAFSTSTLIRGGRKNIIVDTSSKWMRPGIKTSMKQIGILPKEVDMVILTHSHHDHIGNNDMFTNAEIIIHSGGDAVQSARVIDKDMEIEQGVRLVHTPGHTMDSMSVLVRSDMTYAIAGDAVPRRRNLQEMIPPRHNVDEDMALKSIEFIRNNSDMVIPGHDRPFIVDK